MGLNPLKFLKNALGDLAKQIPGVGGLVSDLIKGSDDALAKMSPERRAAFEVALMKDQTENFRLALADSADLRKLAMAELEHPGIKWVRPGILAGLFLIVVFWTVIAPIINAFGAEIAPPNMAAIPDELWWMFGASYLGYGTMREIGKKNKLRG